MHHEVHDAMEGGEREREKSYEVILVPLKALEFTLNFTLGTKCNSI